MSLEKSWYDTFKENYIKSHEELIQMVKKDEMPQFILAMKTVADKFINEESLKCGYFKVNDMFGFNELLVNRLMLFAFYKGRYDLDERSFEKGYDTAMEKMSSLLEKTSNELRHLKERW